MVAEYPAPQLQFAGFGAEGRTPAEVAEQLAVLLRGWTAAHEDCRVLQFSVTPATPAADIGPDQRFGIMAVIVYVAATLTSADAAQAVAAALEEIHEAQVGDTERRAGEGPGPRFI